MTELLWTRIERLGSLALAKRLVWLVWGIAVLLFTWGTLFPTLAFIWIGYFSYDASSAHAPTDITIIQVGHTLAIIMIVSFMAYGAFKFLELIFYRFDESERELTIRRKNVELSYKQRLEGIEALESVESLLRDSIRLRLELAAIFEDVQRIKLETKAVNAAKSAKQQHLDLKGPISEPDLLSFATPKRISPKHWRKSSKTCPEF